MLVDKEEYGSSGGEKTIFKKWKVKIKLPYWGGVLENKVLIRVTFLKKRY